MPEREMRCATCDGAMVYEVPPCGDGHDECPELVCTGCGAAEVLVPGTLRYWIRPQAGWGTTGFRGTGVAPQQRRAA
ncbi:MAG TPA: hypothetical protein VGP57_20645 [Actinoplanes sp.]|nr:hypothetical protein [Actinoplanes sp.]